MHKYLHSQSGTFWGETMPYFIAQVLLIMFIYRRQDKNI